MFGLSSASSVEFLPPEDARAWVADGLRDLVTRLGEPARAPRLVTKTSIAAPRDLDDLFELIHLVEYALTLLQHFEQFLGTRLLHMLVLEFREFRQPPIAIDLLFEGDNH